MDTLFLCTRSREARLRDEPSIAEIVKQVNKQAMECKGTTTQRRNKRAQAMRSSEDLKSPTKPFWEDQKRYEKTCKSIAAEISEPEMICTHD